MSDFIFDDGLKTRSTVFDNLCNGVFVAKIGHYITSSGNQLDTRIVESQEGEPIGISVWHHGVQEILEDGSSNSTEKVSNSILWLPTKPNDSLIEAYKKFKVDSASTPFSEVQCGCGSGETWFSCCSRQYENLAILGQLARSVGSPVVDLLKEGKDLGRSDLESLVNCMLDKLVSVALVGYWSETMSNNERYSVYVRFYQPATQATYLAKKFYGNRRYARSVEQGKEMFEAYKKFMSEGNDDDDDLEVPF